MPSAIRRLPDDVISRIAAGEVIERPASVLKELIENSLDAGATRVRVDSRGAGRELLRVVDNGVGMSPEDCRLAFDRHATSKIRSFEDLDSLSTFGFRGEALFAIAAVSKVTLSSCPPGSGSAWSVSTDGGRNKREHEAPPAPGTWIEVKDLFFNVPARAKFLKKDASEKSQLLRVIEEAALANPGVAFAYTSEGRSALNVQSASLRDRVQAVLGREAGEGLLEASESRGPLKISAFLARPEDLAATRSLQYVFVNRRPVSSKVLQQALYRAYEPFRSRDRHPVAAVFLEAPADRVDVNVHPAKREVRFREEGVLFDFAAGAFSAALLRAKGIPTLEPRPRGSLRMTVGEPAVSYAAVSAPEREPASLFPDEAPQPSAFLRRWYMPPFRCLGQVEKAYLVFEAAGGLLVVDQHAAQERILYERYLSQLESGVKSQGLVLPLALELPASQVQAVLARAEELSALGFGLEAFGKTTLHVTSAPALFSKAADLEETLHRVLESWVSGRSAAKDAHAHAAAMVACKAAVKAHDRLGDKEALALLEDLKDCQDPTACPHGRPSMISLTRDELARRFKRPGAPPL